MKIKNNKTAQLQSSETIFIVFIIIIIIIIALVFYSRVVSENQKDAVREQNAQRLVSFAHTITNWPELECSSLETKNFDCVDLYKLDLLSRHIADSKANGGYAFNYYSEVLGRSKIVVTEIYSLNNLKSWDVYDNSRDTLSSESISIPVNIYDPIGQTFSYAIMEISTYG